MASKPGSAAPAIRATASLVGNTFVSKYYNVLHQSPQVVHRFYTDQSILSRAEAGPSGAIDIVISQAGIDQKIMSLDYRDFRAEIKTVDSLESLNGSVLVMVTGSLSSHGLPKRSFVQTFFLAPQEVGYFVLNDMFRYLDGEAEPLQPLVVPMSNGTIEQHIPAPEQGEVDSQPSPQQEARDYSSSSLEDALPAEQQCQVPVEEEAPEIGEGNVVDMSNSSPPEEDDVAAPSKEQLPPAVEESNPEEAPKKSYASILRVRSDAPGASAATPLIGGLKPAPPQVDRYMTLSQQVMQPARASVATSQSSEGAISASEGPDENTAAEVEGDGRSVYVKNLPLNITVSELEDEFNKFGTIKPGGVNLRNQRIGVCFAFIEFDEPSSAQSVIEASPILIGGRQVFVEEKKPMPMAPRAGRGRFNQGRGYQNDGMRGRGYFGGRGSSRGGGQDFDREGGRGSGASRGSYGGGNASYTSNYGSNFNTVNGYRRADGQGWNGPRPVRTAGNQAGRMRGSVLE